jgi:hypothetical protein
MRANRMIAYSIDVFRYLSSLCYPEISAQPNLITLRTHQAKSTQPMFTFKLQTSTKDLSVGGAA